MSSEDREQVDATESRQPANGEEHESTHEFGSLPKLRPPFTESETSDLSYSFALIGIAGLIFVGLGLYYAGPVFAMTAAVRALIRALVGTVFAVIACYIVGILFGTEFGTFRAGFIKLTAATVFPTAIASVAMIFSPWLGWIFFCVLSWSLLKTLFDLEVFDLCALVIAQASVAAAAANWNRLIESF